MSGACGSDGALSGSLYSSCAERFLAEARPVSSLLAILVYIFASHICDDAGDLFHVRGPLFDLKPSSRRGYSTASAIQPQSHASNWYDSNSTSQLLLILFSTSLLNGHHNVYATPGVDDLSFSIRQSALAGVCWPLFGFL